MHITNNYDMSEFQ